MRRSTACCHRRRAGAAGRQRSAIVMPWKAHFTSCARVRRGEVYRRPTGRGAPHTCIGNGGWSAACGQIEFVSIKPIGGEGMRRTRKFCSPQQISSIRSRTPPFRRRLVSWTIRQRLTRLLTWSIRTRRRVMRRLAAFRARVRARPRGGLGA